MVRRSLEGPGTGLVQQPFGTAFIWQQGVGTMRMDDYLGGRGISCDRVWAFQACQEIARPTGQRGEACFRSEEPAIQARSASKWVGVIP